MTMTDPSASPLTRLNRCAVCRCLTTGYECSQHTPRTAAGHRHYCPECMAPTVPRSPRRDASASPRHARTAAPPQGGRGVRADRPRALTPAQQSCVSPRSWRPDGVRGGGARW